MNPTNIILKESSNKRDYAVWPHFIKTVKAMPLWAVRNLEGLDRKVGDSGVPANLLLVSVWLRGHIRSENSSKLAYELFCHSSGFLMLNRNSWYFSPL